MTYYGTNADGNNLPVWEFDLLNYLKQEFEYYSYCPSAATAEVPQVDQGPIHATCAIGVDCNDTVPPVSA